MEKKKFYQAPTRFTSPSNWTPVLDTTPAQDNSYCHPILVGDTWEWWWFFPGTTQAPIRASARKASK